MRLRIASIALLGLCAVVVSLGCHRSRYRQRADRDVENILSEQDCRPWAAPADYNVQPSPESRLYDLSPIDCPLLPEAFPQLNSYELPQLPSEQATVNGSYSSLVTPSNLAEQAYDPSLPPGWLDVEAFTIQVAAANQEEVDAPETDGDDDTIKVQSTASNEQELDVGLPVQPIPESYWNSLPANCTRRIMEFESIREEYEREFKMQPGAELRNTEKKLDFEDIVYIALLNSREYQAQKELLYRSALALTLQRFDYMTKFSTSNNGVDANYLHRRTNGITVDTLSIPSSAQMDKMLATGGTILARFANSVVLTFNGPDGFAADVSSELLFNFTQSVLQRDVLLEGLVQSERNLVYAARNFARFRRTFYLQLARDYYNLLLQYRRIEIQAQTYFSLIRTFEQNIAEIAAAIRNAPPQIQVDQTEQNLLNDRSRLISQCNNLEQTLDSLKLRLGLPTEMPIDIKLDELEQLTLRDQVEVAAERAVRWRNRLVSILDSTRANDRSVVLNATIFLTDRLLQWQEIRKKLNQEVGDQTRLKRLFATLRVDDARVTLEFPYAELKLVLEADPPSPKILIFQRRIDLVRGLQALIEQEIELSRFLAKDPKQVELALKESKRLEDELDKLLDKDRIERALTGDDDAAVQELADDAGKLIADLEKLVDFLDELNEVEGLDRSQEELLEESVTLAKEVVEGSGRLLDEAATALPAMKIDVDAAMLSALTHRLDLMNQRGTLNDDLRAVKLAADELRSFLNLNASHVIQTRNNRPFEFDIDNSRTTASISLDLPLNRRAQRNSYRNSLINFQASRRSVMASEDNIKFDIRSDMRNLEVIRVQYPIAVTQAALAAERVISTRLSLGLGVQGVLARDLLDALSDSQSALVNVASSRISYITTRAQLALDLEALILDERGLWPDITAEDYQPEEAIFFDPEAGDPYTEIVPWVRLTPRMRNILRAREGHVGHIAH